MSNSTKTSSNNTLLSSSINSSVSYLNPTQASSSSNPFTPQPTTHNTQPQPKISYNTPSSSSSSSTSSSLAAVYEADPELNLEWQRIKANKPDTKAMVRQLEETRQSGAHTLESLHSQGEQLTVIEAMNNEHSEVITQSESYVRRLSGIGGRIADKFRRKSKTPQNSSQKVEVIAKKNEEHKSKDKDDKKQTASQNSSELLQKSDGPVSYDKRTGHPEGLTEEQIAMIEEEDKDLDAMSDILSQMKAMSQAANTELKVQEAKIDRINDQVDNNNYRIKKANIKLGK